MTVFSEEFTDKIISEAVEKKDLFEYKGDVYVACKKKKGEGAGGYLLDHVRNDGGGKFTVVHKSGGLLRERLSVAAR